jgi:hypothetical protein
VIINRKISKNEFLNPPKQPLFLYPKTEEFWIASLSLGVELSGVDSGLLDQ